MEITITGTFGHILEMNVELVFALEDSDLILENYQEAVNYLETRFKPGKQHHKQVKAALKRCLHTPMYLRVSPDTGKQARTLRALMIMSDYQEHLSYNFTLCVIFDYLLDILTKRRGKESVIETTKFGPAVLERARGIQRELDLLYMRTPEVANCKVQGVILERLGKTSKQVEDLYKTMFDTEFIQAKTKDSLEIIREELMIKTWHPSRVRWWMDHEDQQELLAP